MGVNGLSQSLAPSNGFCHRGLFLLFLLLALLSLWKRLRMCVWVIPTFRWGMLFKYTDMLNTKSNIWWFWGFCVSFWLFIECIQHTLTLCETFNACLIFPAMLWDMERDMIMNRNEWISWTRWMLGKQVYLNKYEVSGLWKALEIHYIHLEFSLESKLVEDRDWIFPPRT